MSQIKTYAEQTIAYIKQSLLDGILRPGAPLRETEIAAHLGISRGPVREALQSLLLQGLVTGEPQKTRYIRHLTLQEIEDSYCLGGTLEGACIVQSLESWNQDAFAQVEAILQEMERQSKTATGLAALSQIDESFHNALLAPCSNRLMASVARDSCSHISKFLYYKCWDTLFTPSEFYQRHTVLYEALKSRDQLAIERTFLDHYAESGRRLGLCCGRR